MWNTITKKKHLKLIKWFPKYLACDRFKKQNLVLFRMFLSWLRIKEPFFLPQKAKIWGDEVKIKTF